MKFQSKLAQEAYEEIMNLGADTLGEVNSKLDTFFERLTPDEGANWSFKTAEYLTLINARAIEVAAKIELDEMRYTIKVGDNEVTRVKKECEHSWEETTPGYRCEFCGTQKPL